MSASTSAAPCELCTTPGGHVVWRGEGWRVIRAADELFPALYRLILDRHVAELSDLSPADQARCLALLVAVERALRQQLRPTKINLAAFGNMVPHLHWHVIARFDWDSHFPQPVWGTAQRSVQPPAVQRLACTLDQLDAAVAAALEAA